MKCFCCDHVINTWTTVPSYASRDAFDREATETTRAFSELSLQRLRNASAISGIPVENLLLVGYQVQSLRAEKCLNCGHFFSTEDILDLTSDPLIQSLLENDS